MKDYLKRMFMHDVETVHDDLVGSIVVEALSELSRVAGAFYEYADIPDVGALYRAFVATSGIVDEAGDMVESGDASDVDLAQFRRRMRDRAIDALKAALAGALDDESLARSITAYTAIRAVYDGINVLIDDLCVAIRNKVSKREQQ